MIFDKLLAIILPGIILLIPVQTKPLIFRSLPVPVTTGRFNLRRETAKANKF